jgi:hypothetical protein
MAAIQTAPQLPVAEALIDARMKFADLQIDVLDPAIRGVGTRNA